MIKTLKYMNLAFFLSMVCINILANVMPLGHGKTGAISNKYPNLFTPAPITFSIWAIIYILLAFFIFYQFGFFSNVIAESFISLISIWFTVSCVMNIGWMFSWHFDMTILSFIFMLGLLFSLIVIVSRISPTNIMDYTGRETVPFFAQICIYAFDIYLGWISVATIANVSALLVKYGWNRFGLSEQFWTILILIVGVLLGMLFIFAAENYAAALTIIWAYCGILIKHISKSGFGGEYPLIIFIAILGIFLILVSGIVKEIMHMTTVG